MSQPKQQSLLFRGIYEFEDPSGTLLAAKVPANGSVDLYSNTVVIVKPNQSALFIYKGQPTDFMKSGTFQVNTENVPLLSQLANWKFGFQNPLRCELVFFSNHLITSRRWGTAKPVLVKFSEFEQLIPIRAFGNYNVQLVNPINFFNTLFGTKSFYSVADIDEFIQSQIVELLPEVFNQLGQFQKLNSQYDLISRKLEQILNTKLESFGLKASQIQILSALPSKEIIEALEAKSAIDIIGSQKEYLLYKAANSLSASGDGNTSNDPLQMMMGLMLGKGLIGHDYHDKEAATLKSAKTQHCSDCGTALSQEARFCQSCGKKI